jgi:hypothetical protein
VDINIKTSGGANIVIDKLTQGAYTETRNTLSNYGTTPTMINGNLTTKRGKFFPRGCRGLLDSVSILCDNLDSVSHTLTVKIAPQPGMGPVLTYTLSLSGGSVAQFRDIAICKMWNYDSMFIWVSSDSDAYGRVGYDTTAPFDAYDSTNEADWGFQNKRYFFRALIVGQTVGDLPVSGTVNTIEVPSSATAASSGLVNISPGAQSTVIEVNGAGYAEMLQLFTTSSAFMNWLIYCDGTLLRLMPAVTDVSFLIETWMSSFADKGLGSSVIVTKYDTSTLSYSAQINLQLHFRRSFKIVAKNAHTSNTYSAAASAVVNLIR